MSGTDRKDYRSLGEILRDGREAKGLRVEDVAEATKIAPKILKALEADELDQVAGPLYARSFVKTLAGFYGEDPEWLLSRLDSAVPAPPRPVLVDPDEEAPPPAAPTPTAPEPAAPPPSTTWRVEQVEDTTVKRVVETRGGPPRWIWIAAAVLVLALLVWWLLGRGGGEGSAAGAGSTAARTEEARAAPEAVPPAVAAEDEADSTLETVPQPPNQPLPDPREVVLRRAEESPADVAQDTPAPSPARTDDSDASTPPPSGPATTRTSPAPTSEDSPPARRTEPSAAEPAEETTQEAGAPPTGPPLGSIEREGVRPPVAGEVDLRITALQAVEVEAQVDGGSWQRRRLPAGESWLLTGRDHFSLRLDRPSAVRVQRDGEVLRPPATASGEWFIAAVPLRERD